MLFEHAHGLDPPTYVGGSLGGAQKSHDRPQRLRQPVRLWRKPASNKECAKLVCGILISLLILNQYYIHAEKIPQRKEIHST